MKSIAGTCYVGVFATSYFPVWFITQSAWSSYVASAASRLSRGPVAVVTFAFSAVLTFLQRELLALLLGEPQPVFSHPWRVLVFAAVHLAVASVPPAHSAKAADLCALPVMQAFTQFKVFTLCLRTSKGAFAGISVGARSLLAVFLSVIDIVAIWLGLGLPAFCRRFSARESIVHIADSAFSRARLGWAGLHFVARNAGVLAGYLLLRIAVGESQLLVVVAVVVQGALNALALLRHPTAD
jgi:hypothetical protein